MRGDEPLDPALDREEAILVLAYAVRDLTAELARFRRFQETTDSLRSPAVYYANPTIKDSTLRPTPIEGLSRRSWHERVREKRVSLPVAGLSGAVGWIILEIAHALFDGRLRFW